MKIITLLFFSALLISSCNPLDLNEDGKKRDRKNDFRIDDVPGKDSFSLPNLRDISGAEVVKSTEKDCKDYKTPFVSVLGKASIARPIANCIAKAIDEGLAPLCEDEEKAKKLLEYYEKENNDRGIEEVEEYLADIDDLKYDTADEIYLLADDIFDQCEEWDEDIKAEIEAEDDWGDKLLRRTLKFVTNSECQGLRRSMDHKARTVCKNLNFSKLKNRY